MTPWPSLLTYTILSAIDAAVRLSVQDWGVVLVLAEKWAMDSLRDYAIEHCGPLFSEVTAARQLHLALRLTIQSWVYPAVEHLVTRMAPLDKGEIDLLGSESVAHILRIRDENMCAGARARKIGASKKYDLCSKASRGIRATFPCVPEEVVVQPDLFSIGYADDI
jgi:hypothetical protein